MFDYEAFIKLVKDSRKELKMTTSQFAEIADISEKNLNKIENGHHNPNLETILSIYNALNLPLPVNEQFSNLKSKIRGKFKVLNQAERDYVLATLHLITKYRIEKRVEQWK